MRNTTAQKEWDPTEGNCMEYAENFMRIHADQLAGGRIDKDTMFGWFANMSGWAKNSCEYELLRRNYNEFMGHYHIAREEVSEWKTRALKAEEALLLINRKAVIPAINTEFPLPVSRDLDVAKINQALLVDAVKDTLSLINCSDERTQTWFAVSVRKLSNALEANSEPRP